MLESISLTNFRNYSDRTFELGHRTLIVGPNGAGKTNILEAVALLSVTTSWKTEKDSEVVQWGSPFCRVVSGDRELVIQRHPYYKRIRIDQLSKRVGEVIGTLPSVIFQPDDSALIYGSPIYRRQALDRLLSQTSPGYLKAVTQLQRVLKQRNKLLKQVQEGEAGEDQLEYWDTQLAAESDVICGARHQLMPLFSAAVEGHFHELVESPERLVLHYEQSPRNLEGNSLVEHLQANRYKEIASGSTLYGPHREDLHFKWGEHMATEGMSRGQVRALVLAFKLAEVEYVRTATGVAPILLLDDVFSELDDVRRQKIIELSADSQTILTSTEIGVKHLPKDVHVLTLT